MKMEFFPSTLPVQAPCVLNTVILCCCCHHCCCCWCHHCCCCWCHHCCCCYWCHHCCCWWCHHCCCWWCHHCCCWWCHHCCCWWCHHCCCCLHCCWCWCSWNTQGCVITVHQWSGVPYRVLEGGGWSHNWHKGCFWIQTSATGLCRFVPPHRPLLVGSQCLPQWSALAEGWTADVMVDWSLTHLVMCVLM